MFQALGFNNFLRPLKSLAFNKIFKPSDWKSFPRPLKSVLSNALFVLSSSLSCKSRWNWAQISLSAQVGETETRSSLESSNNNSLLHNLLVSYWFKTENKQFWNKAQGDIFYPPVGVEHFWQTWQWLVVGAPDQHYKWKIQFQGNVHLIMITSQDVPLENSDNLADAESKNLTMTETFYCFMQISNSLWNYLW